MPPNGVSLALTPSPGDFIPLEEKIIDAGGSLPARTVTDIGSVMAVFVPAVIANNGLFVPRDEDLTALGIDADILFFVGVNDSFASNNSLAFNVTLLTVAQEFSVPEPSSCVLLGLGLVGMVIRQRFR